MPMKLDSLLKDAGLKKPQGSAVISGISLDSRQVKAGDLFCAIPSASGKHADAAAYVHSAIQKGAAAILAQPAVLMAAGSLGAAVAVPSADPARDAARLAAAFHGHPADKLRLSGITGTNGKTTTAFLLHGLLTDAGRQPGCLVGTVAYYVGRKAMDAPNTTPSALELQALFAQAVAAKCKTAVMEVSSHALDQGRVEGLRYEAAVFSNLTRDHLDYHGTLAAYGAAKAKLFALLKPNGTAVVNAEDPWSARMAAARTKGSRVLRYHAGGGKAELRAEDVVYEMDGTRFQICYGGRRLAVHMPLPGRFNVANALAAAGAALANGLSLPTVAERLHRPLLPPGRFEMVRAGQPFNVAVDYAHTPDALERLIRAAREVTPGRIITVFGCGGDRDRGKRPLMGGLAATLSDRAVLTSDNPRTEDPAFILRQVRAGVPAWARVKTAERADRRQAIRLALGLARKGDSVLIAGKGHEDYQIVGAVKHHFDDREEARAGLKALGYKGVR
jgi:UDP-N-acetylmuramoyl-L-alanyl-D-glutamate--2,6-diaminopimelate ligase